MIPRRFFWLFDLIILGVAFLAAYLLAPPLQSLVAPGGLLNTPWIESPFSPTDWIGDFPPFTELFWILLVVALTAILVLETLGAYTPLIDQDRSKIVLSTLFAPLAGSSLVALALFTLKSESGSRIFIFSFVALSGLALMLYRLTLRSYFLRRRAAGYYAKNVLLIGLSSGIEWMARYLTDHPLSVEYHLLGYLRLTPEQPSPDFDHTQLPSLGSVDELGELLIHRPIHEVIVVLPLSEGKWIQKVIQECDYLSVLLRIVPEVLLLGERRTLQMVYPREPLYLPALVLVPPHLNSDALLFKRLFDLVVSAVSLVLLAPLFALIALTIKITTPHLPIFYHWRVVGQKGVEFTGYKFTTMQADADLVKTKLLAYNEMSGPVFKIKNDPRVTPLGRFLRKYSLNELPQLWSVLTGDMSLVGPRPAFRHELERYEFWHKRKLSIRPGITCLWQIRGRNKISDFDDWVKMDLEYIDKWSLWLDFKILLRTVWVVIAGTGS